MAQLQMYTDSLKSSAISIVLINNHPSGNLLPSEADKELTKKIKEAGKVLDSAVLDHLIPTSEKYFSFADEGLIQWICCCALPAKLQTFQIGADSLSPVISLRDSNGNELKTSNSAVINSVIDEMKRTLDVKIRDVEEQINLL